MQSGLQLLLCAERQAVAGIVLGRPGDDCAGRGGAVGFGGVCAVRGEPLLHPSVLDFAEKVKAAGNKVHLLTNGSLIDRANVERIAAATDVVKISLDGSSDAVHAATRGKGNFARVTRAIEMLLNAARM